MLNELIRLFKQQFQMPTTAPWERSGGRHGKGSRNTGPARPAGAKIRKRVAAGTFGLPNPGGLVSETFREAAKERNFKWNKL